MLCCVVSLWSPLKENFSKDVHDFFKILELLCGHLFVSLCWRPGHFYGESKMSQFYLDYPLTLVRWNNEVEIAVLTFKSNTQNLQNIFPIALRTVMISNLKLYATSLEDWFYHYHLFLACIGDCFCAPNPVISNHSCPTYDLLFTPVRGGFWSVYYLETWSISFFFFLLVLLLLLILTAWN